VRLEPFTFISTHCYDYTTAHIGDTFHRIGEPVDPMPGFEPAKAMVSFGIPFTTDILHLVLACPQVYAGVFPIDTNDFSKLEESIKRASTTFLGDQRR